MWSSKPVAGGELTTLWLVPRTNAGRARRRRAFDGLGLRGNDSAPVTAEGAQVPASARLGDDGEGFGIMMGDGAAVVQRAVGAVLGRPDGGGGDERTAAHAGGTKFEHAGSTIADLPTVRAYIARMRIATDHDARRCSPTRSPRWRRSRADAMLRVLEARPPPARPRPRSPTSRCACAAARRSARRSASSACSATRARRSVMAPTTDVLYDFIGKAVCGLPLF